MPDEYGSYPADEPVIGANYPATPTFEQPGDPYGEYEDDEYYDDGEGDYPGYYGDGYEDESPARQPIFYVFIALAVLMGAAAIFVLFGLVQSGDDDDPAAAPAGDASLKVELVSPKNNDRQKTGEQFDVVVRATSGTAISRFELHIGDRVVDQVAPSPPASGNTYTVTLKGQFDKRGDYTVFARVFAGDKSQETAKIRLTAIEEPGDRPLAIKGKTLATVAVRAGPADSFEQTGTLEPGTDVNIIGKTRDNEWLLIEGPNTRWVKRSGIQELDSLALVPVREAQAPATPTRDATATVSATASASATTNLPDLVAIDAKLVFTSAGRASLRVTVRNDGAAYSGPVVIGVSSVPGGLTSPQFAFDMNLGTGKSATGDFEALTTPPDRVDVTVRVDPANAIREASEDNNTTTFKGVTAPADPPDIIIAAVTVQPGPDGTITVHVKNDGGNLGSSEIRVKVTIGTADSSQTKTQALAAGDTSSFAFQKFATGTGRVEVFINGVPTASTTIEVTGANPNPNPTPVTTPAGNATPTP
jgi:Bacterial SH3 domain/CARDB